MHNRVVMILAAVAAATFAACSSSTSPAPTLAGTWHVSLGTMDSGNVTPTSFDVVVTASADTFVVSVPTLTWSVGSVVFDSLDRIAVTQDTIVSITERIAASAHVCDYVIFGGKLNAARDSMHQSFISVGDTDMTGTYICIPRAQATITAHK
jgi:uncharacterized protein (DUF169 family)